MRQPFTSTWWGYPCVVLENSQVRVTVVPSLGSKIASIIDLSRNEELLVQPERIPEHAARETRSYVSSEMSGWDEMFPSIIGDEYPDHGEVWTRRFTASTSENTIRTWVDCATVPITFERTISLGQHASIRLTYCARNRGGAMETVLWAAHPQFIVNDGDELLVAAGSMWVCTQSDAVDIRHIARPSIDAVPPKRSAKWWTAIDDNAVDRISLVRAGVPLFGLSWDPQQLPHLGVWVDRTQYSSRDTISFQPATSWHDDVALARRNGTALTIEPDQSVQWVITLTVQPYDGELGHI